MRARTLALVALFQAFAFPPAPPISDLLLAAAACALVSGTSRQRLSSSSSSSFSFSLAPARSAMSTARHAWYSPYALVPRAWRPHLATVLRTPTSRKIFGFLCLNLAYMGVQMAYGVITNSLGLISDGER